MKGFFGKLLKIIAIILIIIAIIYLIVAVLVYAGVASAAAVSASVLGGFGALTFTSAWGLLAISVGAVALAFVVDADTAKKTLNKAVEGVTSLVGAVGGVVGGAAGAAVGGLLSGLSSSGVLGWLLIGAAVYVGYKVLSKPKDPTLRIEGDGPQPQTE